MEQRIDKTEMTFTTETGMISLLDNEFMSYLINIKKGDN